MPFLIFTDLDATLLNHDYTWSEAQPALDLIAEKQIPLILNSSKTLAEMHTLAQELGLTTPIIAENGGQIAIPIKDENSNISLDNATPHPTLPYLVSTQTPSRADILSYVHQLRDAKGYQFSGFSDWDAAIISQHTGLDIASSKLSADRYVTEPILWDDTEENYQKFLIDLKSIHARAIRGGRFIHLMGQADKAGGMNRVTALYQKQFPANDYQRIALGDSPNDAEMLNAADIAVVLPYGDEGHRITSNAPQVIQAKHPASAGWNESILSIIHSNN